MANAGRPVTIARCAEGKAAQVELLDVNLKGILLDDDVRDAALVIISIVGAPRSGKSFLLNLMIRYLEKLENGQKASWLDSSHQSLQGFEWKNHETTAALELILWNRPFILHDKKGGKVAILLMDTQGLLDDEKSSMETCAIMVALSTMLSSVQIFNVMSNLQEDDLQNFELYVDTGNLLLGQNVGSSKKHENPFQRLVILIRDWIGARQFGYGSANGRKYIDYKLEVREDLEKSQKRLRQHLKSCFLKIDCFLMPHPGMTVAEHGDSSDEDGVEFTGQINLLRKKFLDQLEELAYFLLMPISRNIKCQGGICLQQGELMRIFLKVQAHLKTMDIERTADTRKALIDYHNRKVFEKIITEWKSFLEKLRDQSGQHLQENLKIAAAETITKFKRLLQGDEEDTLEIFDRFKEKMRSLEEISVSVSEVKQASDKVQLQDKTSAACNLAMETYRSLMSQKHARATNDTLEEDHKLAVEEARTIFERKTEGAPKEIKEEYEMEFKSFLEEQAANINSQCEKAKAQKEEQELKCRALLYREKTVYKQKMNELLPDEELKQAHEKYKEDAINTILKESYGLDIDMTQYTTRLQQECEEAFETICTKDAAFKEQCRRIVGHESERAKLEYIKYFECALKEYGKPITYEQFERMSKDCRNKVLRSVTEDHEGRMKPYQLKALTEQCLQIINTEIKKQYEALQIMEHEFSLSMQIVSQGMDDKETFLDIMEKTRDQMLKKTANCRLYQQIYMHALDEHCARQLEKFPRSDAHNPFDKAIHRARDAYRENMEKALIFSYNIMDIDQGKLNCVHKRYKSAEIQTFKPNKATIRAQLSQAMEEEFTSIKKRVDSLQEMFIDAATWYQKHMMEEILKHIWDKDALSRLHRRHVDLIIRSTERKLKSSSLIEEKYHNYISKQIHVHLDKVLDSMIKTEAEFDFHLDKIVKGVVLDYQEEMVSKFPLIPTHSFLLKSLESWDKYARQSAMGSYKRAVSMHGKRGERFETILQDKLKKVYEIHTQSAKKGNPARRTESVKKTGQSIKYSGAVTRETDVKKGYRSYDLAKTHKFGK